MTTVLQAIHTVWHLALNIRNAEVERLALRMIIDRSAIMAVLQGEPERRRFNAMNVAAPLTRIFAATLVELSIVTEVRHGAEGIRELDLDLATAGIETWRSTAHKYYPHARRFGALAGGDIPQH
ncbi:MAG: type II toxin-antitoxin system VapC family toxin [Thiohalocapsa sp.]